MSWLRTDDREVLDARIGSLDDNLYRAWSALKQFCAREQRDTGIFPVVDIVHAVYATPKGPKSLTSSGLAKLHDLDLVRKQDDYSDEEMGAFDFDWPDEGEWMRVHNWERFNPPRDKTSTERKRRQRKRGDLKVADVSRRDIDVTSRVTDLAGHGPVTAPRVRASAPVPVPSRPVTESTNGRPLSHTDLESLPFDNLEEVQRLMTLIGDSADQGTQVVLSSYARRLPPDALGKVIETVRKQPAARRAQYANGALRSEIKERTT